MVPDDNWTQLVSDPKGQCLAFALENLGCHWRFLSDRMAWLKKMVARMSHEYLHESISSVALSDPVLVCSLQVQYRLFCRASSPWPQGLCVNKGRPCGRAMTEHWEDLKLASCLQLDQMFKTGWLFSTGSQFGKGRFSSRRYDGKRTFNYVVFSI